MKNVKIRTKQSLVLLMSAVMLVVGACSNGGTTNKVNVPNSTPNSTDNVAATDDPTEEAPFAINLMYNFDGVEFPAAGNEVQSYIEKVTNTTLTINALPGSAFEEKLPVMIASGSMPDAFPIPRRHQKLPYVVNAVQSDMFWEIGPYLDQFPNLSKINPIIYEKTQHMKGKFMDYHGKSSCSPCNSIPFRLAC